MKSVLTNKGEIYINWISREIKNTTVPGKMKGCESKTHTAQGALLDTARNYLHTYTPEENEKKIEKAYKTILQPTSTNTIINTLQVPNKNKFPIPFIDDLKSIIPSVVRDNVRHVVTNITNQVKNMVLDGIIQMSFNGKNYDTKCVRIGDENTAISDHLGLSTELIMEDNIPFNLFTQNLEGFCDQDKYEEEHNNRKLELKKYIENFINKNTIGVFQELVLKNKNKELQIRRLKSNTDFVKNTINEILGEGTDIKIEIKTDTATGGIMYNKTVWNIEHEISIPRFNDNKKYSNAYRFNKIGTNIRFWVINIHLKSIISIKDDSKEPDIRHMLELENIIKVVFDRNHEKYDMYLLGDFNNPNDKDSLLESALKFYNDRIEEMKKNNVSFDDAELV